MPGGGEDTQEKHKKSHGCCDRIACKHNVKWNTFEENTYGSTEGASLFLQLSK